MAEHDRLSATGAYRNRVTVQAPGTPVRDGDGGFTEVWVDAVPPTWAVSLTAEALGAEETPAAGTTLTRATHLARGRYRADITTSKRLVLGARVFNVRAVRDPDERQRTLEVICTEVVR